MPRLSLDSSLVLCLAGIALIAIGIALFGYVAMTPRKKVESRVDALLQTMSRADPARRPRTRYAPPIFRTGGRRPAEHRAAAFARFARLPPQRAVAAFLALRIGLSLIACLGMAAVAWRHGARSADLLILLAACGTAIGWFGPLLLANRLAARRRREVERDLPEALELLIIGVKAGLGLEDAMARVVTEMRRTQAAIAEELALTLADMKIFPSQEMALANLAQRIALPSLRSVVTTLSQTMHYGTPLAQILQIAAADLRNDALLRLEENVNKLTVTLTLPMVLFILPSIFLIVAGPAVLKLLKGLGH